MVVWLSYFFFFVLWPSISYYCKKMTRKNEGNNINWLEKKSHINVVQKFFKGCSFENDVQNIKKINTIQHL